MPILKIGDTATTFVFGANAYIDKLSARNIHLNQADPSAPVLQVDLAHYSRRKRGNLEDSDFEHLQRDCNQISKLAIRDATVAKKIRDFATVVAIEVDIGSGSPIQLSVKTQTADHREVAFEF
ncbi:MAG: hypothetical protein NT159_07475 [Proteobacteria bacterium]|nr:hypothetical protein [Pseudomonadota bacterium]